MTINLKSDDGLALFLKLAMTANVVVENLRKDVKYRLGVDYKAIKKVNPCIVYASISGFGQEGPYSERPSVDQIVQGMSGLMSVTGQPGEGPMRVGIAVSDTSAGMFLGQGILMALLHREKTGKGSWVHTSLLESMLSKLGFQGARYTMTGEVPGQEGNNYPTNSPMGVFDASDGMVNLAASTNKMFGAFTKAVGQPEIAENEKFQNSKGRIANRHELWQSVNDITSTMTTHELVTLANDAGCPYGPIYDIKAAFGDEHVRSLKMRRATSREEVGEFDLVRSPINMSTFPMGEYFERPGPLLGEHTDEAFIEMVLNTEDSSRLRQTGAI